MQRLFYLAAVTIILTVLFTACSKDDDGNDQQKQMTLTLQTSDDTDVWISMSGTGVVTVDWGDGTNTTLKLEDYPEKSLAYRYSETVPSTAIITITGENITFLSCERVQLLSLDVSKNTCLTELRCGRSSLTSLDVSNNRELEILDCGNTLLTNLNVNNNTKLAQLYCRSNRLTTLNVRNNTALKALDCDFNDLTTLNVSNNTALEYLSCCGNNFTTEGLNALFRSLHSGGGFISLGGEYIDGNSIVPDCDISIATNKNWVVHIW